MHDPAQSIDARGFALLPGIVPHEDVERTKVELADVLRVASTSSGIRKSRGVVYAARNLETLWPGLPALVERVVASTPVAGCAGGTPRLVRAIYFDKPPARSWSLPWHRDTLVPCRPVDPPEGTRVFRRAGVPHVHGAPTLLRDMITARVHLDPATPDNGALLVVPGSHHWEDPDREPAPDEPAHVTAEPGDVLLMRPLLLHRSLDVRAQDCHRRIVHLEFSAAGGPGPGLAWP